jgi:DNA-binding NtrC family response regulator
MALRAIEERHTATSASRTRGITCVKSAIVVIDSYQPTHVLMEDVFREAGYTVMCLEQEATVDALRTAQPALIILDLQRAQADGLMLLLNQLRNCDATQMLPIVITTTDARLLGALAQPLKHLGCSSLVKPFGVNQFLTCVARAVGSGDKHHSYERLVCVSAS